MNKKAMFVSSSIFFFLYWLHIKGKKRRYEKSRGKQTKFKKRKCKIIKNVRKLRVYLTTILSSAFNLKSIFEKKKKKCLTKFMEHI